MIKAIREFFEQHILAETASPDPAAVEHGLRLATASLLIEMTRADFSVKESEKKAAEGAMQRVFGLDDAESRELIRLAEQAARQATSLYEFTSLINDHFSPAQKVQVIELMWEVAYADGRLDKYEEHFVRRVADLIYVPHRDFIRTKHRARKAAGQGGKG